MSAVILARTTCRICQCDLLPLLDLGTLYLSDFPRSAGTHAHPPVPLALARCSAPDCGLVQLTHTTPADWLYKETYWYRSGVNDVMRAELADVVEEASRRVDLPKGATVVDIGANDGTLLSHYDVRGQRLLRVAYEPAPSHYEALRPHADVLFPEFFQVWEPWGPSTKARIITAVAMFYDLEDPHQFVDALTKVLHPEGVVVIQQAYLFSMLATTDLTNVCLPAEDLVVTETGLSPIASVRAGDRVLTHMGRYREVLNAFQRPYEGELVELRAYGFGYTLRVTPEHPVYVRQGDAQATFVPARCIKQGDVVMRPVPADDRAVPTSIPAWIGNGLAPAKHRMIPVDDLLEIMGYYLAEGSICTNGSVLFYFGPHETELAQTCHDLIERLGFAAQLQEHDTSLAVQAHGPLSRLLQTHCGRGAGGKFLAPWLLNLSQQQSERLLRAYMAGDGYEYRGTYLRASTVSEQLAFDMAMLANRAGWKASINQQERPATCVIEGRTVNQQPLWDILVHTDPEKKMKVWLEDGYQCGRVYEVGRSVYGGTVHNLEVEEDNTYVSPAMAVHNCHEHLEYYHLAPLEKLLAMHGLEVVDLDLRAINGGSFRVYVQFKGKGKVSDRVLQRRAEEARLLEILPLLWATFTQRAESLRGQLRAVLEAYQLQGAPVDLYAASTKANTLLQWAGVDVRQIRQAWERSPEKIGRYVGVSGIPIVTEGEGRADPPAALLVGAWAFREAFLAREAEYLASGGRVIFPLPYLEVVEQAGVRPVVPA